MNADQIGSLKSKLQQLDNGKIDNDEFTESFSISEDPGLDFIYNAIRKDGEKWSEDKYAIDISIFFKIDDPDKWSEVREKINNIESEIRDVNIESIGLSSPIFVRSNSEEDTKQWSRKILKNK